MTAIAHVGIAVPDLDGAVAWYADALGLEPLGPPVEVLAGEGHAGAVAADVLGGGSFRQAHLTSANGVAVELFEFADRQVRWNGIFHLCVVPPNLDRTAARIAASGGRRTSRIWHIFPDAPYRTCYCEDPFGNTIELYSHSHERTFANREPWK
jgi:catechol 2,3-dioxygenase-like lactoylglutathione lyase family enzyme